MAPMPVCRPKPAPAVARGLALGLVLAALAGCAKAPPAAVRVPYQPPASGPEALITVKTDKMWTVNYVILYLARPAPGGKTGELQRVGLLQSGESVSREVLSFDARMEAGVPLPLYFEYRYDVGAALESGCDYAVTLTLEAGGHYLVDFIKDTRGCAPRVYLLGKDGARTEIRARPQ